MAAGPLFEKPFDHRTIRLYQYYCSGIIGVRRCCNWLTGWCFPTDQADSLKPMKYSTDVVVIGAGPVGLFSIFELGLQGIRCHVLDSLPAAGGQCIELYPDKPIYDIPAVPVCTGEELIERLLEQSAPFKPEFHFNSEVTGLDRHDDGTFTLHSSAGDSFDCRAVIIAAGGGSFTPVKVRVEGIDQFEDKQMFYRVKDPSIHEGKRVVILGGGDSALDWALELQPRVESMVVINRTERFRAAEANVQKLMELESAGKVGVKLGTIVEYKDTDGLLEQIKITLRDEARTQEWLSLDHLLVFFGMSPKLGAIENWGLDFEKRNITIEPSTFETSIPGIYAIGDINTYVGKKKLILSGFHEAALAAFAIKSKFEPDKKINVQYTTTSSLMQERLGV